MLWKYLVKKFNLTNDKLSNYQTKLAAIYALSAWNVMILIFLHSNKENFPNTAKKKNEFIMKEQKTKEIQIIRVDGFHIVDKLEDKKIETDN